MQIVYALVALISSTVGAISGIGGGIIIKPVLDSLRILDITTVNFLSGCTVLMMALSSFIRNRNSKVKLNYKISVALAFGAAIGGYVGKQIFSTIKLNMELTQALILLVVNVGVAIYIWNKKRIKTLQIENTALCLVIGLMLGAISSFLGIGGGPVNIAVLYFCFSMKAKETARNSLFIILFSQIVSLATTLTTRSVPGFDWGSLVLMCGGGVAGAIIGSRISDRVTDAGIEKIFNGVLIFLIGLNVFNIIRCF